MESIRTKGLDRTQLKIIAIIAMVIDHTAWGFLDFYSPLAQFMHVIGRLTIPTMCFFVAEGYRHTTNKWRYLERMASFWIISIIPFYLFFHEEYEYRQNVIFDLMLGLIMLMILDSKSLRKWQKALLAILDLLVSATVGGWVIAPICFIVAFYYGKDFKQKARWICCLVILLVTFLVIATSLNQIYHFSHYDWVWYGQLYFLGFMIPLLLLKHYNGKKGKNIGKYFFYAFYPSHFMVLWGIKKILYTWDANTIYVYSHLVFLFILLILLVLVLRAKPSRGQTSTVLLTVAAATYIFGFTLEIMGTTVQEKYYGTLVEYFGETILMVAFTMFVFTMCRRKVPQLVYTIQVVFGVFSLWMLFTTRENGFFYSDMQVVNDGPFPRFVLDWNTGFWLFLIYMAAVSIMNFFVCVQGLVRAHGSERKRLLCTALAMFCPWLPVALQHSGITGGYEIPALGILGAAGLVSMALIRYQYFDSVIVSGSNAINQGAEGFLVVDSSLRLVYANEMAEKIFGHIPVNSDLHKHDILSDIFLRNKESLTRDGQIYEFRKEDLMEGGYKQGYNLWILNVTEHYEMLDHLNEIASTDGLTQIHNRETYTNEVEEYLNAGHAGTMFMMDMDRFKSVNDTYGHQAGDRLLQIMGHALSELMEDVFVCRLGGDEFSLFYKDTVDKEEIQKLVQGLFDRVKLGVHGEVFEEAVSMSIGVAASTKEHPLEFERLYSAADHALYQAKKVNGNAYFISEDASVL